MSRIPFVAIGNDELGEPVGESVNCPTCGEQHPIVYGKSRSFMDDGTWSEPKENRSVGFYKCGESLRLASIDGRAVP